jgi:hypothetical protein
VWAKLIDVMPQWQTYSAMTDRDLRVFRLVRDTRQPCRDN